MILRLQYLSLRCLVQKLRQLWKLASTSGDASASLSITHASWIQLRFWAPNLLSFYSLIVASIFSDFCIKNVNAFRFTVCITTGSVQTAKLWAIQRWPNWPVWGLLLTIFAYRYIHCNFAEISTGDFIANHWFIDQITLQMPGKIIDRLIWQFLAL